MSVSTETEQLPESRVKITATVEPGEIDAKVNRSAEAFGREMRVPGFRKGKVPAPIVLRQIGREAVLEQALRDSLPEWYEKAIIDSGVTPVGEPSLDVEDAPGAGEPLEFTIEIGVRPEAKLGDYEGLEVPKAEPIVPEDAIDAEIERTRESLAGLETVDRPAEEGDHLVMDFDGEIDGEPIEGGSATDYLYEVGSGTLIPGFDEQLPGASAGETVEVEATFPDNYNAEHLAGEVATFTVEVKEVREKKLPNLDDDFAADNSDFETLEEWREDIRSRLAHSMEHRVDDLFRQDAVDAVVEAAEVEVPEEIAAARATELWERIEHQLQGSGMDPAAYLQMQGKTREEAIEEAREDAVQSIRREAVLAAVAEAEGIEISESELLTALEPPAGEKGNPKKLLKRLRKDGREALLIEDLRVRRASELIAEKAVATEMDEDEARRRLFGGGDEEDDEGTEGEGEGPDGSSSADAEDGAEEATDAASEDSEEATGDESGEAAEAEADSEEE